jgi:hypothetical protein
MFTSYSSDPTELAVPFFAHINTTLWWLVSLALGAKL